MISNGILKSLGEGMRRGEILTSVIARHHHEHNRPHEQQHHAQPTRIKLLGASIYRCNTIPQILHRIIHHRHPHGQHPTNQSISYQFFPHPTSLTRHNPIHIQHPRQSHSQTQNRTDKTSKATSDNETHLDIAEDLAVEPGCCVGGVPDGCV